MKLGIIGMGGAGKTTLFNALTQRSGESAQPGGEAVPIMGVVEVPDTRVDWLVELYNPKKTARAQVTYMDLQGMPGMADKKQEYMSLLLNHMRPMDAFLLVVRNFDDPGFGAPKPQADARELNDEFLIADLATVEKRLEKIAAEKKKGRKVPPNEEETLIKCRDLLNDEKPLRSDPALAAAPELRGFTFLSGKPLMVVVNNDDEDASEPAFTCESAEVMSVRGKLEMEVAQLPEDEAAAFLEDFGITETARERVIHRSFGLLNLISFLTVGEDEVKAWTIPADTPAVEAAGAIHSDIQKGFIRAEVVAYDDLKTAGDMNGVKKAGKARLEGKTYPVQDGDIINFRFNV